MSLYRAFLTNSSCSLTIEIVVLESLVQPFFSERQDGRIFLQRLEKGHVKIRSRHVHNILERKQITFLCFPLKKMANIIRQESFGWNPPRAPFVACKQTPIDIFLWSISIRPLPFRFSSLRIHRLPPLLCFIDRKYRETSAARLIFILFCFPSVLSFCLFVVIIIAVILRDGCRGCCICVLPGYVIS